MTNFKQSASRPAALDASKERTTYAGVCHGTLGELFQGPCRGSSGELGIAVVSLPIKRYSYAHFIKGEGGASSVPADKSKSMEIVRRYLRHHDLEMPVGRWRYASELVQGKGMASSTADLVATIRCLDALFGLDSDAQLIARLMRDVERSDSVFLEDVALYLSDQQELVCRFPGVPSLWACFIDEGPVVDTHDTRTPLLRHYRREEKAYCRGLERMRGALDACDVCAICECATDSARLSQRVLPKKTFPVLQSHLPQARAAGIVVAHTGSLIGYLFSDKPSAEHMGELASFFASLGHQCHFVRTGVA